MQDLLHQVSRLEGADLVRRLVIENAAAHADARCCSSLTSAYFRLAVINQDWATDVYTTFQSRGHAPPAALTAAKDRLRHPRHERPDDEAGSTNANRCPGCAQYHVNAHLDGAISCGPADTALRTLWHDDIARIVHQTAAGLGVPSKLEPASVAADSKIRCDVRLSRVKASKGDAYVDMITHEHTQPDTWDREAALPGIFCDKEEAKKCNKHFLSVEASDVQRIRPPLPVPPPATLPRCHAATPPPPPFPPLLAAPQQAVVRTGRRPQPQRHPHSESAP